MFRDPRIFRALPLMLVLAACQSQDRPQSEEATPGTGTEGAAVDAAGGGEPAARPPFNRAEMPGRVYDSDFGELTLDRYSEDGASGRYLRRGDEGASAGTFEGQVSPAGDEAGGYDRIEGFWVQAAGSQRCDAPHNGSHYWGRFQFNFMRDSNDFLGFYGHCDGTPLDRWNGRYLRQVAPTTDSGSSPAEPAATTE